MCVGFTYEIEAASILRRWETPSNHFHPMLKGVGVCHPPCRDDHAPVSLVVWRLSGAVRLYGRTGHGSIRSWSPVVVSQWLSSAGYWWAFCGRHWQWNIFYYWNIFSSLNIFWNIHLIKTSFFVNLKWNRTGQKRPEVFRNWQFLEWIYFIMTRMSHFLFSVISMLVIINFSSTHGKYDKLILRQLFYDLH